MDLHSRTSIKEVFAPGDIVFFRGIHMKRGRLTAKVICSVGIDRIAVSFLDEHDHALFSIVPQECLQRFE